MKIFKFFRKSSTVLASALLVLMTACSQYDDLDTESPDSSNLVFDYELFNQFQSNQKSLDNIINSVYDEKMQTKSALELNSFILNSVNKELGTDLVLSDVALTLPEYNADEIFNISLAQGWMSEQDIDLAKTFMSDLEHNTLDMALSNYEQNVLQLDVTKDEFARHNVFVNMIKSIDKNNPELFKNTLNVTETRDSWRCALAIIALAAATTGLAGCATVVACGLSLLLYANAVLAVRDHCFTKPTISDI